MASFFLVFGGRDSSLLAEVSESIWTRRERPLLAGKRDSRQSGKIHQKIRVRKKYENNAQKYMYINLLPNKVMWCPASCSLRKTDCAHRGLFCSKFTTRTTFKGKVLFSSIVARQGRCCNSGRPVKLTNMFG